MYRSVNTRSGNLRKFLDRAIEVLKKNNSAISYASVISADPDFFFPDKFLVSDYEGLLSCHILKGNENNQIVTYWTDEDHCNAYVDAFRKRLSLPAPWCEGKVIIVHSPREHWWKRYPVGSYVLAFAALFGALLTIQDYFGILFATPDVEFSYAVAGRLDVIENTQVSVPLTTASEVRFAPTQITIDSVTMQPKSGGQVVNLKADPQALPSLGSGQSQTIKLEGTVPNFSDSQRPAEYDLSVKATAKAGIFRFARQIVATTQTVWIWPLTPKTSLTNALKNSQNACEMDGNVYVSEPAPPGTMVLVEVVLTSRTGEPEPMMIVSPPPGVESPSTLSPNSRDSLQKAEFRFPAPGRFQRYPYKVFLEFTKQVSGHDCQDWLGSAEASADWTKIGIER